MASRRKRVVGLQFRDYGFRASQTDIAGIVEDSRDSLSQDWRPGFRI